MSRVWDIGDDVVLSLRCLRSLRLLLAELAIALLFQRAIVPLMRRFRVGVSVSHCGVFNKKFVKRRIVKIFDKIFDFVNQGPTES